MSYLFETIQKEINLRGMLKMKDEDQSREDLFWGISPLLTYFYFLTCLGLGWYMGISSEQFSRVDGLSFI